MKPTLFSLVFALCSLSAWGCTATPPARFVLSKATRIVADDPQFAPLKAYIAEHLAGDNPQTVEDYDFVALAVDSALESEEYRVEILSTGIRIAGGGYGGVFNGVQALFELLPAEIYARRCPRVEIADTILTSRPRYPYRAMMLDVARTWCGVEAVERKIDLLAYHRINKLHLHLTDDEGWRIEIKSHPELTEIGGWRGGDSPVRPVYGKWHERYGGFFTQDEMRHLIRYASVRNIEIIPEIDLPGHSRTIASVHPEIRCAYRPDTVSTRGYDFRSAWCVARAENYALLEDILSEICALFPARHIHIGGDEVDMEQWMRCPDCRALMQREGITSGNELEDLFLGRVSEILRKHGKQAGVWNEAVATAKLDHNTLVYGWKDTQSCVKAIEDGYPTIVMPGKYFYLDMRQTRYEDGHDWAGIVDARRLFGFDFEREGFSQETLDKVIGFEGAFWSEAYISHTPEKPDYLDYMTFPRMTALAHIAWYGTGGDWSAFYEQLIKKQYDRLAAMGVCFRLFPPKISYSSGRLSASVDDGSALYYIAKGSTEERLYTAPIATEFPMRYQFISRYKTGRSPLTAHPSFHKRVYPAVAVSSSMGESTQFPYTNAAKYRGITRTRRTARPGDWIRYDFTTPQSASEIFVQTGNPQLPKSLFITGYVETSADGKAFRRVGELHNGAFTLRNPRGVKSIRVVSTSDITDGTPFITIEPLKIKPLERPVK